MREGRCMKKLCWIALAALTAILLGPPVSQAGDGDKAKDLFDKMEKKITGAKTLQVEAKAKEQDGDKENTITGKVWLATGNKARMELKISGYGKEVEFKSISDGTKTLHERPGKKDEKDREKDEKDTEKDLGENVGVIVARTGMVAIFFAVGGPKGKVKASELLKVSDFKLGKKEKVNGKEA